VKLYINDILMASNDLEMIVTTKGWRTSNFDIKDMGDVSYVLGLRSIEIDLRGFSVSRKIRT